MTYPKVASFDDHCGLCGQHPCECPVGSKKPTKAEVQEATNVIARFFEAGRDEDRARDHELSIIGCGWCKEHDVWVVYGKTFDEIIQGVVQMKVLLAVEDERKRIAALGN